MTEALQLNILLLTVNTPDVGAFPAVPPIRKKSSTRVLIRSGFPGGEFTNGFSGSPDGMNPVEYQGSTTQC